MKARACAFIGTSVGVVCRVDDGGGGMEGGCGDVRVGDEVGVVKSTYGVT